MDLTKSFEGPIKSSVNSVFEGLNASIEAFDLFQKYYNAHISSIKSEVEHIKLFGMSQSSLLNDLYTPANLSTTIKRRLFTDEWLQQDRKSVESRRVKDVIPGMEFIQSNNSVAILGGPGAGKTTFLKYIALTYADKTVFQKHKLKELLTPFFLSLPALDKTRKSIFNYICDPLIDSTTKHAKAFVDRILKNGSGIILLDSLDEVNQSRRNEVIDEISKFRTKYPKIKLFYLAEQLIMAIQISISSMK